MSDDEVFEPVKPRKLRLANESSMVGGVCAGLAYRFEFPVLIIRLIWAVMILGYGAGILPYLLLWFLLPDWEEEPSDFSDVIDA